MLKIADEGPVCEGVSTEQGLSAERPGNADAVASALNNLHTCSLLPSTCAQGRGPRSHVHEPPGAGPGGGRQACVHAWATSLGRRGRSVIRPEWLTHENFPPENLSQKAALGPPLRADTNH